MDFDMQSDSLGNDQQGQPVFLKDIWPTQLEIQDTILKSVRSEMFQSKYAEVFAGDEHWKSLPTPEGDLYAWDPVVDLREKPALFHRYVRRAAPVAPIERARVLALLGDSITTDHISPAGSIKKDSPAGKYLIERGVKAEDFNSYGRDAGMMR